MNLLTAVGDFRGAKAARLTMTANGRTYTLEGRRKNGNAFQFTTSDDFHEDMEQEDQNRRERELPAELELLDGDGTLLDAIPIEV